MSETQGQAVSPPSPPVSPPPPPAELNKEQTEAKKAEETKKAEEAKKAESQKAESLKLESFKFPEGVKLDDPVNTEFIEIVNNDKLSPTERTQALLDLHYKTLTAASEEGSKQWDRLQDEWEAKIKSDPVFGGDKVDENLGNIAKLIDQYSVGQDGKPDTKLASEVREALELTGAGNNPALFRLFANVAKTLVQEGRPAASGSPQASSGGAAERMFPTMVKT